MNTSETKTYRVCVYEVVNGEPRDLVDIIEFETEPMKSGQNVFHLLRQVEKDICTASELETALSEAGGAQ